jgi:hypothetical protein
MDRCEDLLPHIYYRSNNSPPLEHMLSVRYIQLGLFKIRFNITLPSPLTSLFSSFIPLGFHAIPILYVCVVLRATRHVHLVPLDLAPCSSESRSLSRGDSCYMGLL